MASLLSISLSLSAVVGGVCRRKMCSSALGLGLAFTAWHPMGPSAPAHAASGTAARAPDTTESPLREFIASAAGGAAQRLSKDILLHPLDTIRCRLELQGADRDLFAPDLYKNLYAGVLPSTLVGTPGGALFFATKDSVKSWLALLTGGRMSKEAMTVAAVIIAQFPYWALRTPGELVKTRLQASEGETALAVTQRILQDEGVTGMFLGYGSNIAYATPTDIVKFAAYESLKRRASALTGAKLSPLQSAVCGAVGSAVAQATCTPLDVVRTRLIAPEGREASGQRRFGSTARAILDRDGVGALFAGILPRVGRALASGALQFGTLEATRRFFGSAGG